MSGGNANEHSQNIGYSKERNTSHTGNEGKLSKDVNGNVTTRQRAQSNKGVIDKRSTMFDNYNSQLDTPAGTLSIVGNSGEVTFDIDDVNCGTKPRLTEMVVLHIALNDMEQGEPYTLQVKNTRLKGFEPTAQGIRYATTLENGITFGIDILDPAKGVSGFSVIGAAHDYRLELGSENELSIVSQTDEPDTYAHIAVAWAPTEELAKASLFLNVE